MYPKTVSSKQFKSVCSSSQLNTTEKINHMAQVKPVAVFTLENIAAARKAITICKLMQIKQKTNWILQSLSVKNFNPAIQSISFRATESSVFLKLNGWLKYYRLVSRTPQNTACRSKRWLENKHTKLSNKAHLQAHAFSS